MPPKRRLVVVEWNDSHGCPNGWNALDELQNGCKPVRCRSVGWVASEANGTMLLVSSISGDFDDDLRVYARGDIAIPRKAIVKVRTIRH